MTNIPSWTGSFTAVVCALAVSSCGPRAPGAEDIRWSLTPEQNGAGYLFEADARLLGGQDGWFSPRIEHVDADGCRRTEFLLAEHGVNAADPSDFRANFRQRFDNEPRIAKATLQLVYRPAGASPSDFEADRIVFSGEKVIDTKVRPPVETKPCASESDAASPPDTTSKEEQAATLINLSGYLCGRVKDAYASGGDTITVHCTEYRDGRGRAKYKIHTGSAQVERLD